MVNSDEYGFDREEEYLVKHRRGRRRTHNRVGFSRDVVLKLWVLCRSIRWKGNLCNLLVTVAGWKG